jgi:GDPmannose 4,6-dehydratase
VTYSPQCALVTGAAGQDGALLTRLLLDEGVRVVGLVQPGSEIPVAIQTILVGADVREVDLRDRSGVAHVIDDAAPDEVYNLAAISSVAASWRDPALVTDVNAVAVLGMLEILRATQRPVRFLQASSAQMFGLPDGAPQDEQTPLQPRNPYAVAKAFAHHATATYRAGYGLHASTVILYNHESVLRDPDFVTRKITSTVAAIGLGLADELVLGDLDVRRDWGHAGDYVRAMHLAVQRPVADDYVVATGVAHSVRDLLDVAFRRVGIDNWAGYVRSDPAFVRPTDAPMLVGDASKARRLLGWEPTHDFATLVTEMVDYDHERLVESR